MTDASLPSLTLEEIAALLPTLEKAVILTHVNPDGDCVGSAFALKDLIRACGGDAKVVFPTPLPKRLAFLASDQVDYDLPDSFGTAVAVDVASPRQLGDFETCIPSVRFMIDHHGVGTPFAPNFVDPSASAAGEIVFRLYRLLRENGSVPSMPDTARRLYAAILSDTGSFRFSNTTPATHEIAAALVDEIDRDAAVTGGADTAEINRLLFASRSMSELAADRLALENLRVFENGKLAMTAVTREELRARGLTDEDVGNMVEIPRSLDTALVALSIREEDGALHRYKVSSRANAEVNCAAVCRRYGGGGHPRAAGCTVEAADLEEAVSIVADAFLSAISDFEAAGKEAEPC
ncbi:MAG: bifunctional oligoribonuclease/PAP phosphatase NrnA [Clostridia bacterium]|nr:bifunctional oligoribonuclease/PAP phosphatase NrnA [Clostridia bacterium]